MQQNPTTAEQKWSLLPIGIIHSCFTEKFGIPRQPGMVDSAIGQLELLPPYNRQEMVRGLDQFSHIWVHFGFHETLAEGWKPTVRPPGLGGQKRVGVFATRSPHRPNHLGLSAVRLDSVRLRKNRLFLDISGIDFLDQTPVFDIKPYIPYSDCLPSAACGYALGQQLTVDIVFSAEAESFCADYLVATGRNLQQLIEDLLRHDPRPASQRRNRQNFGMLLWDINIRWIVEESRLYVKSCRKIREQGSP